jgi:hypothetical protein
LPVRGENKLSCWSRHAFIWFCRTHVGVPEELGLLSLSTGRQAEPPLQYNKQFKESRCIKDETLRHSTRDFVLAPTGWISLIFCWRRVSFSQTGALLSFISLGSIVSSIMAVTWWSLGSRISIFDPVGRGGSCSPFRTSRTSHDEFSSISLGKGVTTRRMGDMMGDSLKQESPEDVFHHGRSSPDVAVGQHL